MAELADPPKQRVNSGEERRAEEMHTWTAPELRSFLNSNEEDFREWFYPVVLTATTTGMRRGEVLGLRRRDVDLDAGRASIRQTVVCVGHDVCFSEPKTKKGTRSVPLAAETVAVLREHEKRQKLSKVAYTQDLDLVFAGPDGAPLDPESVSLVFARRVRRSGLPRISFHELRHTWATLALESGVAMKVVSEILGHANISITADTYSHVRPAMQEDATSCVAAVVFGAQPLADQTQPEAPRHRRGLSRISGTSALGAPRTQDRTVIDA